MYGQCFPLRHTGRLIRSAQFRFSLLQSGLATSKHAASLFGAGSESSSEKILSRSGSRSCFAHSGRSGCGRPSQSAPTTSHCCQGFHQVGCMWIQPSRWPGTEGHDAPISALVHFWTTEENLFVLGSDVILAIFTAGTEEQTTQRWKKKCQKAHKEARMRN
jgi:hypothetical protein